MVSVGIASAQSVLVSQIEIHTDPQDARIRPFESIAIQVRAYGEIQDANGDTEKVRLREGGASIKLSDSNAGWISKPFRFQGKDDEPFYQKESAGFGAILLGQAQNRFLLQDAVLFTASDRTGKFKVEAELNGQKATLEIDVDRGAPSRKPRERTTFNRLPASRDPYRNLVEHYAPMIAQETWFEPKSDYVARVDLDGDWRGDNNWENAFEGSSQAYAYYAVMETETHWFLIYNFFHPRDYSDKCVAGTCHENDNEGLILTVRKDGSRFGRLQVMESLAHNNIYSYRLDRAVKKNVHSFDGDIELYDNSHPVIFIEAGGHGVYGSDDSHSQYSFRNDRFSNTGVTYVYKGVAERPKHGNDRKVGYNLLPIYDHWWVRAHEGNGKKDRTFDAYYRYEPFGNRPRTRYAEIAGSFYGKVGIDEQGEAFLGLARQPDPEKESARYRTVGTRSGVWCLAEPEHAAALLAGVHVQSVSRHRPPANGGAGRAAHHAVRAECPGSSARHDDAPCRQHIDGFRRAAELHRSCPQAGSIQTRRRANSMSASGSTV